MSKATQALIEIGKNLILFCQNGPNTHCIMHDGAWIALSGVQKVADLNMIGITAAEKGLIAAGQAPFMEKVMTTLPVITSNEVKAQLCDCNELTLGNSMAGQAFGFPDDSVQQATPSKTYDHPAIDLWMAKTQDNHALGCGSFISDVDGRRVGIYAMATPPNNQQHGAGRAVIEHAMQYYQAKGVKRFTLAATELGFPLYQKLGFKVVVEPYVFILGSSTQFP